MGFPGCLVGGGA